MRNVFIPNNNFQVFEGLLYQIVLPCIWNDVAFCYRLGAFWHAVLIRKPLIGNTSIYICVTLSVNIYLSV